MSAAVTQALSRLDSAQDPKTRPLSLKLILRLVGFMRPYARLRNWLALIILLRAVQVPLLAWYTAQVLNIENGPIATAAAQARQGVVDYTRIWWYVAGFGLLALFTQLTMHYRQFFAMKLGELVVHDLRNRMFEHIQRLTMRFSDRNKLGRTISRMTSDVEAVRSGVQDTLFMLMLNLAQMVVAAAFMIWASALLFILLLAIAPVLFLIGRVFRGRLSAAHRSMQESFSRVTANVAESVSGIRVTQGFVRQQHNADMFGELVDDHADYHMSAARLQGVFTPLLETTNQFFTAALFILGGWLILGDHIQDKSVFIDFLLLSTVFFGCVQSIANQYASTMSVMAGAERVFSLLDTEPDWSDPPDVVVLPQIRGHVEFRNLTFGYDPAVPVLHEVSFVAQPGQTVALVGHTGSGKSSIINLISKFYLPTSGELLLDGHDIRTIDSKSLHRQMGIVLQQNFLFSGTVMDNIRFARPDATDADVFEAARKLNCLDLLESLPDGLYTEVGERGGNMSLGQRQLVCFTRAMLADPRIMILDEATSSVDGMTEARIQRALEVLLTDRTSFVVAHRLSTIRHADMVLVLDHGRIVERGSHVQLLATGGVYANLYRQFIRSSEGS